MTTGIGKLLDIPGFAKVIETYQFGLSGWWASSVGLTLALFELQFGLFMMKFPRSKWVGPLLTLMHVGYTLLAIITLARGVVVENCGCFGVFLARPMTIATVFEDLGLVVVSVLYWWLSSSAAKAK